ncbi:MAG: hypothetical protein Q8K98_08435 [Bacteroidota bacterium]|nr:hypothetical protein [Bacteroidota bacterium]
MDLENLIYKFQNTDLKNLSKYEDKITTKNKDGIFFPPYIPFVGNNYQEFKLLFYASAQNIPQNSEVSIQYSKNFDKLVERLYYNLNFDKKYPKDNFDFSEILIAPYQKGILPAIAGIYFYIFNKKLFRDFNIIQDNIAISNYYKFSLYSANRDINPNTLQSGEEYWDLNDKLVKQELQILEPSIIITFNGRHVNFLKELGYQVKSINDPSWILRGAKGCLTKPFGSWYKLIENGIKDDDLNGVVEDYLNQIHNPYKRKKEQVKIYLLKYSLDWRNLLYVK